MAQTSEKTNFNMSFTNFNRFSHIFFLFFFSAFFSFSSFAQPDSSKSAAAPAGGNQGLIDQGGTLFKQNCTTCHAINEVVVGPALKGVDKRRDTKWIINFVHNSSKVIADGDPYAVALYNKFGKTQMTSFPGLSDQEITSIVEYIKTGGDGGPPTDSTNVSKTPLTGGGSGGEYSTLTLVLIVVVLVLVIITLLVFLTVLRKYLKDKESSLAEEDQELINQKFDLGALIRSKAFIGIVSFVFVCAGVRSCWNGMLAIGVEQGYQPVQPIPFSHKLHAGQYKIDCNYCHTGVNKGKQANIPSLNICMNCHSQIKKGPLYGEQAIAQVIEAYNTNTPVKWVRVHNLPDLAYFNHAQHVKVGGLECQTCHGSIDTMNVVSQHSPLTMGWCINCHRETSVNGKDNAYYDRLLKLHSVVSKKDMKVADIGGLECSKCHY
jgi:mono/diheme cytochrome c family protein